MKIRNGLKIDAGFTLIEVLMYIALFVLLVGTLLGVAFQTIASIDQINKKIVVQQEADFILRKIDWALSNGISVSVGPKPSDMVITRLSIPNVLTFSQNGNFISLNDGFGTQDLNSANVAVSNLIFSKSQIGLAPPEIQVSFNLADVSDLSNTHNFQLLKYLRQ
jgi:hypothetical protein